MSKSNVRTRRGPKRPTVSKKALIEQRRMAVIVEQLEDLLSAVPLSYDHEDQDSAVYHHAAAQDVISYLRRHDIVGLLARLAGGHMIVMAEPVGNDTESAADTPTPVVDTPWHDMRTPAEVAQCPNGWHDTAPARARDKQRCPECPTVGRYPNMNEPIAQRNEPIAQRPVPPATVVPWGSEAEPVDIETLERIRDGLIHLDDPKPAETVRQAETRARVQWSSDATAIGFVGCVIEIAAGTQKTGGGQYMKAFRMTVTKAESIIGGRIQFTGTLMKIDGGFAKQSRMPQARRSDVTLISRP